jgi:UDP-glucose 4-epimerase
MRQVYEAVIQTSGSKSKVRSLPKAPTIAAMMAAHKLHISPLGPYHYKMIAESFVFDTTRIKQRLNWKPTLTNEEMLLRAYDYYAKNRTEITNRTNVSTHRKPASMGVIRLLKWIS